MEESNESMMERAKESKSNDLMEKEVGIQQLPQDILFYIPARLPAKFLIKLKTSCKLWFSIISDPHFVDFHLQQQASKLIIFEFKEDAYHFWSFNFKERSNIKAKKVASLQKSQYFFGKSYMIYPKASCDDVILFLSLKNDIDYHETWFWVFNSISHTLKLFPALRSSISYYNQYLLVHDASINNYKVLVLCFGKGSFVEKCCIFALEDDDHISINGVTEACRVLPCPPFLQKWVPLFSSVAVNGVLCWTAKMKTHKSKDEEEDELADMMVFIQSLDITREEFKERIKPPCQPIIRHVLINYTLLAIKGSLCLMNRASVDELDIWVLKNYGVNLEYEWFMQYKITLSSMVCKPVSLKSFLRCVFKPVFVMESCHSCLMYMFLSVNSQLFCYNMESQEVRQIAIEDQDSNFRPYPCITGAC